MIRESITVPMREQTETFRYPRQKNAEEPYCEFEIELGKMNYHHCHVHETTIVGKRV